MKITDEINNKILELASDFANERLIDNTQAFQNRDKNTGCLEHAEEAPDVFNNYYNDYNDAIRNFIISL